MPLDITATLGVPGSASTWVFNVVRELRLSNRGSKTFESFYSDMVDRAWTVFRDHRHLERIVVWKLHEPDASWAAFLAHMDVKLVISIRDPRDSMLSLMERFGETKRGAFDRVSLAFSRIVDCLDHAYAGLRYEDRFFDAPGTVTELARHLHLSLDPAERDRIFATYQTATVKQFGQALADLPGERARRLGNTHYDEVTQIHRTHIGDQRIGKWRDQFDAEDRKRLNAQFRTVLDAFGYDRD